MYASFIDRVSNKHYEANTNEFLVDIRYNIYINEMLAGSFKTSKAAINYASHLTPREEYPISIVEESNITLQNRHTIATFTAPSLLSSLEDLY